MIVKILGILDILAGILFWIGSFFGFISPQVILIVAFYLIAKGAAFLISEHLMSALDVLSGIVIFASLSFAIPEIMVILITLYLLQKGIFSMF